MTISEHKQYMLDNFNIVFSPALERKFAQHTQEQLVYIMQSHRVQAAMHGSAFMCNAFDYANA
jgi:hypothetical protein